MWKLSLDASQTKLIAQLKAGREVWQQSGTYDASEPSGYRRGGDHAELVRAIKQGRVKAAGE